ncbi:jg19777 [Pararge aegeria aegeria]|uniref:Jg19777 protein n=1 Tax=Pararge aegeria aegeria TaxID=348720 RepID=A0A8S4SM31_9NEOP|nr:jg19777 [Pararge aegeria aegeria]
MLCGMLSDITDFATQIICAPIDLSSGDVVGVAVRRARSQLRQHNLYIARQQSTTYLTAARGRLCRQFPLSPTRQPLPGEYESLARTTAVEMNWTGSRPTLHPLWIDIVQMVATRTSYERRHVTTYIPQC